MSGFWTGGRAALVRGLREQRQAELARLQLEMDLCEDAQSLEACRESIRQVKLNYDSRLRIAQRLLF